MLVARSDIVKVLRGIGVQECDSWPAPEIQLKVNEGGIARFLDNLTAPPVLDPEQYALYESISDSQRAGELVEVIEDGIPPTKSGETEGTFAPPDVQESAHSTDDTVLDAIESVANGEHSDSDYLAVPEQTAEVPTETTPPLGVHTSEDVVPPPHPRVKRKYTRRVLVDGKVAVKEKPKAKKSASAYTYRVNGQDMVYAEMKEYYAKNPLPVPEKGVIAEIVRILKDVGAKETCITKAKLTERLKEKFSKKKVTSLGLTVNNLVSTRLRDVYGLQVWKRRIAAGVSAGKMGYWLPYHTKRVQPGKKVRKPGTGGKRK